MWYHRAACSSSGIALHLSFFAFGRHGVSFDVLGTRLVYTVRFCFLLSNRRGSKASGFTFFDGFRIARAMLAYYYSKHFS